MYHDLITKTLKWLGIDGLDPRHVEAYMRLEYSTLDHLGGARWDRAVREAAADVAADTGLAERLAKSYGL